MLEPPIRRQTPNARRPAISAPRGSGPPVAGLLSRLAAVDHPLAESGGGTARDRFGDTVKAHNLGPEDVPRVVDFRVGGPGVMVRR